MKRLSLKSERSFWLVATLIFATLPGIIYFPALLGKVPFPRDLVLQFPAWGGMVRSESWQSYGDIGDLITAFYPARAFAARAVRGGSLPLWNPDFLGGAPFLASPQSSLFYPPNFLYYLFSLPTAWTLCLMIRLFLSGMFTTLFVRTIGGTRAGSIFAGIAFSLCGFMTAWQGQPMGDGAAWLPFVCYAVLRIQKEPSSLSIGLAGLGFAMPVLAGHPEAAAHVTFVGIVLAIFTFFSSRFDVSFLLRFTAAGLLAIGLASIQLIPTLEWLGQMPNALDARWPGLAWNNGFGWVTRDIFHSPNSAGVWIPEGTAYAGMVTLIAAPLGLLHRNRRLAIFFAGLTVSAIGMAYAFEPIYWMVNHIPVLSGLKNGRMILVAGFALAVLSGLGISALEEQAPLPFKRRALALAFVTTAFLTAFVLNYKLQLETQFRVDFAHRPSFSRTMLFVGLILILFQLYSRIRRHSLQIAVSALIAFDLITFSYGYTGFAGRDEIFPPAPVFDFLEKHADPAQFRIASAGLPYSANAHLMYDLAAVDGYEVRIIPNHRVFSFDYTEDRQDGINFLPSRLLKFNDRRLDMLNVKYLVAPRRSPEFDLLNEWPRFALVYNSGYMAVFENKSVLPRAVVVPERGVLLLPEIGQQLATLRDPAFDPERKVVVAEFPPSLTRSTDPPSAYLPFSSNVEILEHHINQIAFRTSASERAVLVVSQTFYPGWNATIDGKEADVFRANITLTGVGVPGGVHEVRLTFRPTSFKVGATLTVLAVMCLAVVIFRR